MTTLTRRHLGKTLGLAVAAGFILRGGRAVAEDAISVHIDNFTFEIEHVGGTHAPDSVVVRVPQAKVMFVGDCYYPPPMHLRNPGDSFNFAMMRSLIREDIDWYIDGHTEPMTREQFAKIATSETPLTESL